MYKPVFGIYLLINAMKSFWPQDKHIWVLELYQMNFGTIKKTKNVNILPEILVYNISILIASIIIGNIVCNTLK